MAGVGMKVDTSSAGPVADALRAIGRRADDMTPLFETLGQYLRTSWRRRFRTNVGPDGTAWRRSQRAARDNGQTLVDRGHMRDSVTFRAGPREVAVGSNDVRAAIHNFGGRTGRGGNTILPARPFIGLSKPNERGIATRTVQYLKGGQR